MIFLLIILQILKTKSKNHKIMIECATKNKIIHKEMCVYFIEYSFLAPIYFY